MADDPTLDPFTRALNALWAALAASTRFNALVPVGNRINYTSPSASFADANKRDPSDKNAKIRIIPAPGGGVQLSANSMQSTVVQVFRIEVEDISQDIDKRIFPIKYAILTALSAAGQELGVPSLIVTATPTDLSEMKPMNGGNTKWKSVASIVIQMRLLQSKLKADNSTTP